MAQRVQLSWCVPRAVLCVGAVCRYVDERHDRDNWLRRRFSSYDFLHATVLAKGDDVELKAPVVLCDMYKEQTEAVLNAIQAVAVSGRHPGG